MSQDTGNIVIELEFNGKPSALATTKAHYWVIYDGIDYNWFTVDSIYRCIVQHKLKLLTFTGKGDTKAKMAYLIPKDILYKYKL